ncbi:MAG TPA: SdpI family protein [Pyrinomonadaceae bacterium]|nr:SdpI family protein [Pyrinomonadaceae bacterium]
MKKGFTQFLREEWLQLLIIALPLGAALLAMPYATQSVPMQWNLHGKVTWFAPKSWGLLVLPATTLIVFGLIFLFEVYDKNRRNPADNSLTSHGKAVRSMRFAFSLVLVAIGFVQIEAALGRQLDVTRLVPLVVGLLLAFIGNLFGKLKPNRYVGIRVPWTLNSETVWRKTHRVAGWLWVPSGIAIAALSLIAPTTGMRNMTVAWLVVISAVPLFVAWHAAREERQTKISAR